MFKSYTVKTASSNEIIPVLQEMIDNKLYVPNYSGKGYFENVIKYNSIKIGKTEMNHLSIAVLYNSRKKPVAWVFYRRNIIWSYTKPFYRKLGFNKFLVQTYPNPLNVRSTYAFPHPKFKWGNPQL